MKTDTSSKANFAWSGEGRLGLALSGGGFRAALFHVGVLAALADRDLLRHVSVISTVSGGGIIGAFYFLKLKQLLEGKREDNLQVDQAAYQTLIREIETEFLDAVQTNLRIRVLSDRHQNARMLASEISSSERIAAIFDQEFFAQIHGQQKTPLSQLKIRRPVTDDVTCPSLILNTTALNTGRLFQLSDEFVGELPLTGTSGVAQMPHLHRLRFNDNEISMERRERLQEISLGQAVAATCCVPGLFEPLSLSGLYGDVGDEEVCVRLVDGGVYDNQALASLRDAGCSHFLCSDASELLGWNAKPEGRVDQVALRANDIMMDRIRGEVMAELRGTQNEQYALFVLGNNDGSRRLGSQQTQYLQMLRAIRTDLDAFNDVEAWALMLHGYELTQHTLPNAEANSEQAPMTAGSIAADHWKFAQISSLMEPEYVPKLFRYIEVGANQFFKAFYFGRKTPWAVVLLPLLVPIGLTALTVWLLPPLPRSVWIVLAVFAVLALTYSQNGRIIEWIDRVPWLKKQRHLLARALQPIGVTAILGALIAAVSHVNLRVFNALYLRYGSLRGLRNGRSHDD